MTQTAAGTRLRSHAQVKAKARRQIVLAAISIASRSVPDAHESVHVCRNRPELLPWPLFSSLGPKFLTSGLRDRWRGDKSIRRRPKVTAPFRDVMSSVHPNRQLINKVLSGDSNHRPQPAWWVGAGQVIPSWGRRGDAEEAPSGILPSSAERGRSHRFGTSRRWGRGRGRGRTAVSWRLSD